MPAVADIFLGIAHHHMNVQVGIPIHGADIAITGSDFQIPGIGTGNILKSLAVKYA